MVKFLKKLIAPVMSWFEHSKKLGLFAAYMVSDILPNFHGKWMHVATSWGKVLAVYFNQDFYEAVKVALSHGGIILAHKIIHGHNNSVTHVVVVVMSKQAWSQISENEKVLSTL